MSTRDAPSVINGVLMGPKYAFRLSEIVSVVEVAGNPHPYYVRFRSGEALFVAVTIGNALLAALGGMP